VWATLLLQKFLESAEADFDEERQIAKGDA
ncbi:MAG: hypothetical protein RLZZ386_926, partial [Planctomycetota bacterium]